MYNRLQNFLLKKFLRTFSAFPEGRGVGHAVRDSINYTKQLNVQVSNPSQTRGQHVWKCYFQPIQKIWAYDWLTSLSTRFGLVQMIDVE
ncbi:MAG: hypothetical protein JNK86_08060 [Alphaproteobacteria bacterium]|nr:hypothetical protein [Alphaproteobacteria bacterium]